jgi:DNA-binding transcriptional LysR family regulator
VASDYAIKSVLWPKLRKFLPEYSDIEVELSRDNGLTDIVTQRYDAGVRMGEQLAKDMISVRIGPDIRFAVVGTPSYFKKNPEPSHPPDLARHNCITERHPTSGGIWAWEFQEKGREIKIRVDGQLVFNNSYDATDAALDGFGLAYVPEEIVKVHIAKGRLTRVLERWSPYWDGYHLYYPSRRQSPPAFLAVVDALRHRA